MEANPFYQINQRFDPIESLITKIKEDVESRGAPIPKERLTRKEIQAQFKVSLSTIHKLMKSGQLAYHKVGRKTLFKRQDVENFFQ